ncbi:MAG: DUF255 domain-containing protein [Actinomycetota bacterium]|nr:DUF255 domain-containing protein [Actinomycetota bacterium]
MKDGPIEVNGSGVEGDFRFSPRSNLADRIRWMSWGEAAFNRAREEKKLVLLSISAVWCHWCHVMDETSYSDSEVIRLANERYVPVRVDSDRNPDINRRYNQGGWPTTAFLDPDGTPLAGATYMPPDTMRKALVRMADFYKRQGTDMEEGAVDGVIRANRGEEAGPELIMEAGSLILRAWDRAYGGLGTAPKFPQTETIGLALEIFADGGDREFLHYARGTLDAMIGGNLLDKVEGGFFRYSTTRDWSIPHYEKMLADNASLLSILLRAYAVTGSEIYRGTALGTAEFIRGTLSDGVDRFYGSQDADEGYYLLDKEGRDRLPRPPVDETVYTDLTSMAAMAFLEAGIVVEREDYISQALSSLDFLWSKCRREGDGMAHYHDRGPRRWGLLEDQVLASRAFTLAFGFTGHQEYLRRAEELLRLVIEDYWDDRSGILYDMTPLHTPTGLKPQPADPGTRARAAEAMLLYGAMASGGEWRDAAGRILAGASDDLAYYGIPAAPLAGAANLYLKGPVIVRITGGRDNGASELLKTALLSPLPRLFPLLSEASGEGSRAEAEVCSMQACRIRTSDTGELAGHLRLREDMLSGSGE